MAEHEKKVQSAKRLLQHYFDTAGGDDFDPDWDNRQEIDLVVDQIVDASVEKAIERIEDGREPLEQSSPNVDPLPKSNEIEQVSQQWRFQDEPFWQILGAALHHAGSESAARLKWAFPEKWAEALYDPVPESYEATA